MPTPEPPAFVKMPSRPNTERRREQGEEPKGKKLSRVVIKMRCRIFHKDDHNARRCPKNPEAGKKANAHIKRVKTKKRKLEETGTEGATGSKTKKTKVTIGSCSSTYKINHIVISHNSMLTQGAPKQPRGGPTTLVQLGPSQPTPSQDGPSS
jgi:hypothetical protein